MCCPSACALTLLFLLFFPLRLLLILPNVLNLLRLFLLLSLQVATHAAAELRADKLLVITGEDVRELRLPHYLPLDDAEAMITASVCGDDQDCILNSLELLGHADAASKATTAATRSGSGSDGSYSESGGNGGNGYAAAAGMPSGSNSSSRGWQSSSSGSSGGDWLDVQQQQAEVLVQAVI